jgi:hypothetical protein
MAPFLPPKKRAMLSIERASGSLGVCGVSGCVGELRLGSWLGEGGRAVIQEATKGLEEGRWALAPSLRLPPCAERVSPVAKASWLSSS